MTNKSNYLSRSAINKLAYFGVYLGVFENIQNMMILQPIVLYPPVKTDFLVAVYVQ